MATDHSTGGQDFAAAPDHGEQHKPNHQLSNLTGGASDKATPANAANDGTATASAGGQSTPDYDASNQPDFAYHKPGSSAGAGIVGQIMGTLGKGGSSSG